MSRLNDLIRQLRQKDPALADDIEREVGVLTDRRAFGLNFERHTPEVVELPGRRVRRGDKVRILPPRGTSPSASDDRLWRVRSFSGDGGARMALLEVLGEPPPRNDSEVTASLDDLVVVAEFRDPIHPGLVSTGRIERGGDQPFHTVINAENFHALQTLLFTHRGKIDCIYIDPPYNTGSGDWIYNDDYVGRDDVYRHSKWLAFMERRLILARELLKDTGVIIVAIGDDEHHRLRMLLDQIFGTANFLANITWQGSGKNDARYTAGRVDYMLVYAQNLDTMTQHGTEWRERKPGLDQVIALGKQAWFDSGQDPDSATQIFRRLVKKVRADLEPAVYRYDQIDQHGRVFQAGDLASPNFRANLRYTIYHPITRRAVRTPENGWRYSEEKMAQLIDDDRIVFGRDETTSPRAKRLLSDQLTRVPYTTFTQPRMPGSRHVESLLGDRRFPNPKDYRVILKWLEIIAPRDAVILDFFGGSGSTLEATARLNDVDGGTRVCLLVTNNELSLASAAQLRRSGVRPGSPEWESMGVYEHVTRPRVSTLISGTRPDGSTYDSPVAANLEFFTLTYEAPLRVASNREFEKIAPLLWMRAGSRGRRIDDISAGWDVADTYGVIADFDATEKLLKALVDAPDVGVVFAVTDDDWLFQSLCRELPEHVEPVRLYEAYLRNFEIGAGQGLR